MSDVIEDKTTDNSGELDDQQNNNEGGNENTGPSTLEEALALIAEKDKAIEDARKAKEKADRDRDRQYKKAKAEKDKETDAAPALTDTAKLALVRAELRAEGLTAAQAARLAKLHPLEDVDLDGDEVIGVDLDDIKELFPQLFEKTTSSTPPAKGKKTPPIDTGNKNNKPVPNDPREAFANKLLGRD